MPNPTWVTAGGSIGNYVDGIPMSYTFSATPSNPANAVNYVVIMGTVPNGLALDSDSGNLSGVPASVSVTTSNTFTVRATEFSGTTTVGFTDRTFQITITDNPPAWITPIGSIGNFNQTEAVNFTFQATAAGTGNTIRYTVINGSFPESASGGDFVLDTNTGILTGIPAAVTRTTTSTFTLRATEYSGTTIVGISDRVFTMSIVIPQPVWITAPGSIGTYAEGAAINYQFLADPGTTGDTIRYAVLNGSFPETTDINSPMTVSVSGLLTGIPATVSANTTNTFTLRALEYSGSTIRSFNDRTFSITIEGPDAPQFTSSGPWTYSDSTWVSNQLLYNNPDPDTDITITVISGSLPPGLECSSTGLIQGYPDRPESSSEIYNFTLRISNGSQSSDQNFQITVEEYIGIRSPTIYNTQPPEFDMSGTEYAAYYFTAPSMGLYQQDNQFIFKIIGHDWDDEPLTYTITGLDALGLTANAVTCNTETGWISGTLRNDIGETSNTYPITAQVARALDPLVASPVFNYTITLLGTVDATVEWISPSDLGEINNGAVSVKRVLARSSSNTELDLEYTLASGNLPPGLTLNSDGEIMGRVPFESVNYIQSPNQTLVYEFTVTATSTLYPAISATRTFTITTVQRHIIPYDNIYIQAYPGEEQENIFSDLVTNTVLIPNEAIYRPDDPYFGRQTTIRYNHMFGIPSSITLDYVRSVIKNHYRRNITLGELQTARATDEFNQTIYEVVYSRVIDDLVNIQNISISKEIIWPRPIPLFPDIEVDTVYPNSLPNMRTQVADNLGLINDSSLLPLWMTSQQDTGSSSGYVAAVVLCYTKPGYSNTVVNNINDVWNNQLNVINFELDRFEIDRSISYEYNSEVALWSPEYDSANNVWENTLPSAVETENDRNSYVYFSRNILTEAADQTMSPFGTPIRLVYNTNLSAGTTITVPLKGTVDVQIDWGDNSRNSYSTPGNYTHTYSSGGIYTVTISGTLTGWGSNSIDNSKLASCMSWGDTGLTDLSNAFANAVNLTLVPIYLPRTVTTISGIFTGATSFNGNISLWSVSNVTDMSNSFAGATNFNQNLSLWSVGKVTNMTSMFTGATNFNQNLTGWCVSNIPSAPTNFSVGSALTTGNLPLWGTCPNTAL